VTQEDRDATVWEPMSLREVGDLKDLVLGGTAKTGSSADPGDAGKPPGQG
jgi:hypothetical protein